MNVDETIDDRQPCAVQTPFSEGSTGTHNSDSPCAKSFNSDESVDLINPRKKIDDHYTSNGQKLETCDHTSSDEEEL